MVRSLTLRTFVTNSGIMALGLLASVFLSRCLGPAGRGEVAAAMLWPVLLVNLGSLGLFSSCLYFTAQKEYKAEIIFTNGLVLAALQSVATMSIGFMAMPWLLSSQTSAVVSAGRLYLLVVPMSLATQYGTSILQGRMRISTFNWLRIIIPLGYLIGLIALKIFWIVTLWKIVILHLGLNLLALATTLIALLRSGVRLGLETDTALAKQMLNYGMKVQVGDVSQLANLRLDQVLLAGLLSPAYLGLYVVAVSSASVAQALAAAVRMITTPCIANEASPSERTSILQTAFRRYWLLGSLGTVIIGALLPFAIPMVFGIGFKDAVWPAEVLLLGTFIIGAKDILAGGAQALGNPWLGSRAELVSLVVTIILLPTLLPIIGIMGAAIASLVAYSTALCVILYGLRRFYSISPVALLGIRLKYLDALLAGIGIANR